MNPKQFGYIRNLTKLNRALDGKALVAEFTHFAETQRHGHGRNGASTLVSLTTTLIEASGVYFTRWSDRDTRYVDVLVFSRVSAGQTGFGGRGRATRIEYTDSKGKPGYIDWPDTCEEERLSNCVHRLSPEARVDVLADPWKYRADDRDLNASIQGGEECALYTAFVRSGLKPTKAFTFTDRFSIRVDWSEVKGRSVTIGWRATGTYSSLPCKLRLRWSAKDRWSGPDLVKTVRLRDIGVETSGYYEHSENQTILPEQVKAAKALAAEHKRKAAK